MRVSLRELFGITAMSAAAMSAFVASTSLLAGRLVGLGLICFAIATYFYYKPNNPPPAH